MIEVPPDGVRTVGVDLHVGPLTKVMRKRVMCERQWVSTYDPFALIDAALAPEDRRALYDSIGIHDDSSFAEGDIAAAVFINGEHLRWADTFYDAHDDHPDANLIPIAAVALACARGRGGVRWEDVRELVERASVRAPGHRDRTKRRMPITDSG